MRSFEQYINESRQKYIFGGTDDRNINVEKTFGDMREGDEYYKFYRADDPRNYTIFKRKLMREITIEGDYAVLPISPKSEIVYNDWIPKKDIDSEFSVSEKNGVLFATSFEVLKVKAKDIFHVNIDEKDIIDYTNDDV